jgi:hypothetical protein
MRNLDILKNIIKMLEENHLNLYHDIRKSEVANYISKIKNWDDLDDIQFDYELLKLFALFKDAHTSYYTKRWAISHRIIYVNKKFYVLTDGSWQEISHFGEMSAEQFYSKMKELMNYETDEWCDESIRRESNNGYYFQMLGLMDKNKQLNISLVNGQSVLLLENKDLTKNNLYPPPYSYKILNENILYVKYFRCIESKTYPFKDFVKDVAKEIEDKNIHRYILDVRNNIGGGCEILNPFQNLVKEKQLIGVMIINKGVISSARFAVARFKKYFNTLLIGESTGGAAKSYGCLKSLEFEGKKFSVSTKFFDFSDIFGYEGSIKPDIFVPVTIQDIQNNKDKRLEMAIECVDKITNFSYISK